MKKYDFDIEGLTQYPWVGKNYKKTKLLIVGESLYTDRKHKEEYENPEKLREIIKENAIQDEVKMFRNLNHTIMGCDGLYNTQALWDNVAYCEFVQRIMDYTKVAEQPDSDDFNNGAKVFKRIIQILKPGYCLFLGVRAADKLGGVPLKRHKFNKVYPREFECKYDGGTAQCLAIKHPSAFFSWKDWGKFISRPKCDIRAAIKEIQRSASANEFVTTIFPKEGNLGKGNPWTWDSKNGYLVFRENFTDEVDMYAEFDFNTMEMSYGYAVKKEKETKKRGEQEKLYKIFKGQKNLEETFKYCGYSNGWLMFNDETFSYSGIKEQWGDIYKKMTSH